MKSEPLSPPEDLLEQLESPSSATRLEAARLLGGVERSDPSIVRALERTALNDADEGVRQAALQSLSGEMHQSIQRGLTALVPRDRLVLLNEIERLHSAGLVPAALLQVLRGRYAPAPRPASGERRAGPPLRPASLTSFLFSEVSVRIALFLGAFFVIAAAFILAALVEVARLPILGLATLLSFGAAGVLSRRLPLASFVFFIVATLMIPIDAGVIFDLVQISPQNTAWAWSLVALLVGAIWTGGTYLYRSRLLSLLALLAYDATILLLASAFEISWPTVLFALGLAGALAVAASAWLRTRLGSGYFWPLFAAAVIQTGLLLASSAAALLLSLALGGTPEGVQWLSIAGLWLVSSIVYAASDLLTKDVKVPLGAFRLLAVAVATPVPLFALETISPEFSASAAVAWAWGLALAALSEVSIRPRFGRLGLASAALLWAGVLLFAYAAIGSWAVDAPIAVAYFLAASLALLVLSVLRLRTATWLASLVSGYLAYLASFELTGLARLELPASYQQLFPFLALLAAELIARKAIRARPAWWQAPVFLGAFVGLVVFLVTLVEGVEDPLVTATVMGTLTAVSLVYAVLDKRQIFGYAAAGFVAFTLMYLLRHWEVTSWVQPFVGLSAAFYLAGRALELRPHTPAWSKVLRWSGLALGALTGLLAPIQGDLPAILGVAIVAALFTLEAFLERNVWLGIPANLLYFEAYVMVLYELQISEPQFFTIAAALLGIIMHYLFLRSGHRFSALAVGVTSQLVLLSTTYVQMVASGRLVFFFILFFQSLVLLAYGLAIRSKSFVVLPILFSVLGVISVAFSILSGVPTALIIGCTGLLLLGLGISALLFRERLREVTDRLGQRWGTWSG